MSREEEQNKFWKFIHGEGFWWDEDNNTLGEDEWTIVWKWITSFCKRKVNKALTSRDNEWRERIKSQLDKTNLYTQMSSDVKQRKTYNYGKAVGCNDALINLLEQMEEK